MILRTKTNRQLTRLKRDGQMSLVLNYSPTTKAKLYKHQYKDTNFKIGRQRYFQMWIYGGLNLNGPLLNLWEEQMQNMLTLLTTINFVS